MHISTALSASETDTVVNIWEGQSAVIRFNAVVLVVIVVGIGRLLTGDVQGFDGEGVVNALACKLVADSKIEHHQGVILFAPCLAVDKLHLGVAGLIPLLASVEVNGSVTCATLYGTLCTHVDDVAVVLTEHPLLTSQHLSQVTAVVTSVIPLAVGSLLFSLVDRTVDHAKPSVVHILLQSEVEAVVAPLTGALQGTIYVGFLAVEHAIDLVLF